jgi:predicted amidohydrolase
MKIALIQFNANDQKQNNIQRALAFIQEAASKGASWILLPEVFLFRGNLLNKDILASVPEPIPGVTTQLFQDMAKKNNVHILLGSILEQTRSAKPGNTSVAINKNGEIAAKYQKINLFDARVDGKIICEADFFTGGDKEALTAVEEFKVGLSICYDLRFPALYQEYARLGANVLTVPSCFTRITGQVHWETLLRARAIENLCYVLAPNQVGKDARGIEAYGHSMVVSPWGEVIVRGSADKEEIIYADISTEHIIDARAKLPGIIK